MHIIEQLTDAEIAEAHRSADIFEEVSNMTAPLHSLLSMLHAFEWLDLREADDQAAVLEWLNGAFGDPAALALGKVEMDPQTERANRFRDLLQKARQLVDDERFLHWQVAFPGVWFDWEQKCLQGGFDAVIGNPPWDRMKLQQVEWFAARRPEIAKAPRAADRKRLISVLHRVGDPLWEEFTVANDRTARALRMARKGGDYPLLGRGDINLYSLFVERAMTLVKPDGMVGLLTPSGIASDKTAARFFRQVSTNGRLRALYDFENRRTRYDASPFFADVDSRFKFCVFVASPSPVDTAAHCGFFLQDISELDDPDKCFTLTAEDFARVNPNTGTAPIFRSRRDAVLTTGIYDRVPVLLDRSSGQPKYAWPVKYTRMFDMTNDSGLFRTLEELVDQERSWPIGANRYKSPAGEWVPLYEGKMVQAFDHRAAGIVVNPANVHRSAQPKPATLEQHRDPNWLPDPQYWVLADGASFRKAEWRLVFKDVTAPTNVRSMIAALIPGSGVGNTLPVLTLDKMDAKAATLLLGNLNAVPLDYTARQKIQGQHLNWYILEQLPVVAVSDYRSMRFGSRTAEEIVHELVLELTYVSHDMVPFAHEMGYVDNAGKILPPFQWDEKRRLLLRAKLDAVYFHLYGITDRDDVRYVYSTFPIVERQEQALHGSYLSRDLCLAWINALSAGEPDADFGP